MMVFFLDADGKVYARYGGRDATSADARQSLAGLRSTMESVLEMHRRKEKEFAPREEGPRRTIRQIAGSRRRCFHCHQVREVLDDQLKKAGRWSRDSAYRYPLPDNLGLLLEVDRGNLVRKVAPESPAAKVGLRRGDVVRRLGDVPIHSQADVQFALDRAPTRGEVPLAWTRDGKKQTATLVLPEGWKRGNITWRPSLQNLIPFAPLDGTDLTAAEKKALGLPANRMAFRQANPPPSWARAAGIRAGDVILGFDSKVPPVKEMADFQNHVRREYLVGDRVRVDLLRDGKPMSLAMTLK